MKITKIMASRKDDLLKLRDEYDSETRVYEDRISEGESKWKSDLRAQTQDMERKLSEMIGPTKLQLEMRVDPWGSYGDKGWSIRIQANERNKFADAVALAWNWEAKIDGRSGEVAKDSGSWSGLKAVTPEQLADLEESVRVLKILNNIDWKAFLMSPKAEYDDYISKEDQEATRDRKKNRPNFEADLEAATIEDAIGGNTAFELDEDQYFRGHVWILPTGLTDKFIKGYIFPDYQTTGTKEGAIKYAVEPRRTLRSHLVHKNGELVSRELA